MADEKDDPPPARVKVPRVRRRAPTIDLKATEVAVEPQPSATVEPPASAAADAPGPAPAGEQDNAATPDYSTEPPAYESRMDAPSPESPPPDEPEPPRPAAQGLFPSRPLIEGGLGGGLVALVIVLLLWAGGFFSATEAPPDRRVAQMETQLRELASRPTPRNPDTAVIDQLNARVTRLESAPPPATGNGSAAAGLEPAVERLQAAIAELARRADDNAAATREARGQADAAQAKANTLQAAVERNNIEALANRVTALERASKTLSEDVAKSLAAAGDRPLRAAVAAQALRAAVERGEPFVAELSAVKALAADPQALAALEPFAAGGLPTTAILARQLADLAPGMQKVAAAPAPAGGFLDRLQANAEKLVRVRPVSETPGDEPAAVLGRAQAKAARSDLAGAVAELNALPADMRAPAQDWISKATARDAAINASRRLVTDAIAALGKASP